MSRLMLNGYTEVYVDGCYLGQTGTAGYGIYWGPDNPNNHSGRCRSDATNNVAEIQAAKLAIVQADKLNIRKLLVYTDCKTLVDAINGNIAGWRAYNADYEDLKRTIDGVQSHIDIKFKLVAAHSGNPHHNAADRLARKGASS